MKLIIAIVRDVDSDPVSHALTSASFRVTGVASSGGFLRKGRTTLLVGVEDEQLEPALTIFAARFHRKKKKKATGLSFSWSRLTTSIISD